jgi:phosphoribosylanthranilate isomerase
VRVKICGITKADQAIAISRLGADTLGFICVPSSPRYLEAEKIAAIAHQLKHHCLKSPQRIGVFANAKFETLVETVLQGKLTGIQCHGNESPTDCRRLREEFPYLELIKAFRVKSSETLTALADYAPWVDGFLFDAYHPQALGGTGQVWDWTLLQSLELEKPWFLAGGLMPENIRTVLQQLQPPGIDLSSGVEKAPGDKDLNRIQQLFTVIGHV